MGNNDRATIPEVIAFFEADGRKMSKLELGKLKKATDGEESYDQIAVGIGNGSLTYE
jgi:hypothetical protein